MAVYEYACPGCGAAFELKRSMADADLPVDCPSCGTLSERKPSLFGFYKGNPAKTQDLKQIQKELKKKKHPVGCPCCVPRRSKPKVDTAVESKS
jgi:putative FmdB family regulatory protein